MMFRQAKQEEIEELFREGYKVWHKGRTLAKYCSDNAKEDAYGTRYVIEENGVLVSSLILLRLKHFHDCKVYGIGSVLTPEPHKHRGYASALIKNCLEQITDSNAITFLYSEVSPSFYERFQFRVLPSNLQKDANSICMGLCSDVIWQHVLSATIEMIPDHF